jgi:cell division protein FtsW (lipid II flippase)
VSGRTKIAIAGIIIGFILLFTGIPWEVGALIILAAIAVPVGAYLMLDPSQRRRLKNIQQRRREIR